MGQSTCGTTINGKKYDLSPLNTLLQKVIVDFYEITYTPCVSMTCGSTPNVALCQKFSSSPGVGGWSVGDFSTAQWLPSERSDEGFQMRFTAESGRINAKIDFLCDPSFTSPGTMEPGPNGGEPSFNNYHFQWKSVYACPARSGSSGGGGGLSGGWIFIIVLLSVTVVYFVGGYCFNRFYRKEEGLSNQIPQYGFWVALPGLVKDGCVYSYRKTAGFVGRATGKGDVEYLG
jgi:hypothetical protein